MRGSPLPALPIQPLVDAGIFSTAVAEDDPQKWTINFRGVVGTCTYVADYDELKGVLAAVEAAHSRWPDSCRVWLRHGLRRYWMCDGCGQKCGMVVVTARSFFCRNCYRRAPGPYSTRHRNALLIEAEEAIREESYRVEAVVTSTEPQARDDLPRKGARKGRSTRTSAVWRRHDMLTQIAIDRGQGLAGWSIYERVVAMARDELVALPTLTGHERPAAIMALGQVPELDLRVLRKRFEAKPGTVLGYLLRWGEHMDGREAALFVDRRGPEPLWLIAHQPYELDDLRWQRLTVVEQETGRIRFGCPIREVRCDVLYLRGGVFASWEAQRLVYPSQRAAGRKSSAKHG